MPKTLSTPDGCRFEIRGSRLYYAGPVPPESSHLQAYDYARRLFAWFLQEYPLPESDEDALVHNFASLLGARLLPVEPG